MIIALLVIAIAAAGTPIIATIIVSMASIREERLWSLDGKAPGPTAAIARRIVDFHAEGRYPVPRSRPQPQRTSPAPQGPAAKNLPPTTSEPFPAMRDAA
jgi:hypothetical protein